MLFKGGVRIPLWTKFSRQNPGYLAPIKMKLNSLTCAVLAAMGLMFVTACDDKPMAQESNGKATQAAAAPAASSAAKVTKDSPFQDKVSYALGASVGTYIATVQEQQKEMLGEVNQDLVIKGFTDAVRKTTDLSEQEITDTLMALENNIRETMEKQAQDEAAQNLADGKKFLEDNAKREGVKVTDSGLQYEVIKEGKGATPTPTDTVQVKYKGTVISGEVFDEQTDPISFPLSNIIPGWVEGLQLMKEGSIYKLYIPADLAYGDMAAGPVIKPNSVLIFEVELVKVIPGSDAKSAPNSDAKAAPNHETK